MPIRIAINGFGRIGRTFLRLSQSHPQLQVVAVNDLATAANMAHLLKYDTVHGPFRGEIELSEEQLRINNRPPIALSHCSQPDDLPWRKLDLDFVLEATGRFKQREDLQAHLNYAPRIILSAPPLDDIKTIVLGVNDHQLAKTDRILSNASCTTHSAAPLIEIMRRLAGFEHAYITTVHSYTTDQRLQDGPHKDFRRGRAAAESIVPTTTGAAKALGRIFPDLAGRLGGAGIRVPVPDGSLTDITFTVARTMAVEDINQAFEEAAASSKAWRGLLGFTRDPIVSRDVIGNTHSSLFDAGLTSVLGKMVKIVGWYDNETGYSARLCDLILRLAKDFA